jgi:hypothetical protein
VRHLLAMIEQLSEIIAIGVDLADRPFHTDQNKRPDQLLATLLIAASILITDEEHGPLQQQPFAQKLSQARERSEEACATSTEFANVPVGAQEMSGPGGRPSLGRSGDLCVRRSVRTPPAGVGWALSGPRDAVADSSLVRRAATSASRCRVEISAEIPLMQRTIFRWSSSIAARLGASAVGDSLNSRVGAFGVPTV